MATSNEKLCLAIINNGNITNIDFNGVATDLGLATANAADCRWRRFKKTISTSTATTSPSTPKSKTTKLDTGKKRGSEEMKDDEEDLVRRTPSRRSKSVKKVYKVESEEEEDELSSDSVKKEGESGENEGEKESEGEEIYYEDLGNGEEA